MAQAGKAHTRVMANDEYIRQFHKLVDKFVGHNHWEIYTDFLQLAADAFLSDRTPEHPREKHYMEIMSKYKDEEPGYFGDMLGCVMCYMAQNNKEIISEMWENYASNAQLGQFFTPWHVCQFMAEMQLQNVDWEQYTPEEPCRIADPSCGGGRTLVAALQKVPLHKLDSVLFHGIDIDGMVCCAAALNMLFFNANSYIVHGNALTCEVYHVYRTIHHWSGGRMIEITDPDEMKRIITMGLKQRQEMAEKAKPEEVPEAVEIPQEKEPEEVPPEPVENVDKTVYKVEEGTGQLLLF